MKYAPKTEPIDTWCSLCPPLECAISALHYSNHDLNTPGGIRDGPKLVEDVLWRLLYVRSF